MIENAGGVRTPMITLRPVCAYEDCRSDLDGSAMLGGAHPWRFEVGFSQVLSGGRSRTQ